MRVCAIGVRPRPGLKELVEIDLQAFDESRSQDMAEFFAVPLPEDPNAPRLGIDRPDFDTAIRQIGPHLAIHSSAVLDSEITSTASAGACSRYSPRGWLICAMLMSGCSQARVPILYPAFIKSVPRCGVGPTESTIGFNRSQNR